MHTGQFSTIAGFAASVLTHWATLYNLNSVSLETVELVKNCNCQKQSVKSVSVSGDSACAQMPDKVGNNRLSHCKRLYSQSTIVVLVQNTSLTAEVKFYKQI